MARRRDVVAELVELRARGVYGQHLASTIHLEQLTRSLRDSNVPPVSLPVFPVRAVAIIESFFAGQVVELCNRDSSCVERLAEKSSGFKLDMSLASALYGRKFSIGEFVAHQLNYSSIDSIWSSVTIALNQDFPALLRGARRSTAERVDGPLIIDDWNSNVKAIKELFRLRHIFCHELASEESLTRERVEPLLVAAGNLLAASEIAISRAVGIPNLDTTADMLRQANAECDEQRARINQLLPIWRRLVVADALPTLESFITAREVAIDAEAALAAALFGGGTMAPVARASAKKQLLEDWGDEIDNYVDGLQEILVARSE